MNASKLNKINELAWVKMAMLRIHLHALIDIATYTLYETECEFEARNSYQHC